MKYLLVVPGPATCWVPTQEKGRERQFRDAAGAVNREKSCGLGLLAGYLPCLRPKSNDSLRSPFVLVASVMLWPEAIKHLLLELYHNDIVSKHQDLYNVESLYWTNRSMINRLRQRPADSSRPMEGKDQMFTDGKQGNSSTRNRDDDFNYLTTLFDRSPIGIISYKASGAAVSANEAAAKAVGASRDQLLLQNFRELESWRKYGLLATADEALTTGTERELETLMVTTFGKSIWLSCRFVPFHHAGELHLLLMFVDDTARKQAEEALRESEEKYRSLFSQSVEGIYLHDFDGNIVEVNQAAILQSGYSKDELLRLSVFDLLPDPSGRDDILRQWAQWPPNQPVSLEATHRHKDGTVFPVIVTTGVVRFGSRQLLLALVRDITERKRTEKALRESEERYRKLVEISPDMITVTVDGKLEYVNPAFVKANGGVDPSQFLGKEIELMIHPDDRAQVRERIQQQLTTGLPVSARESRFLRLDGSMFEGEAVATPFIYKGVPAVQAVVRDITERKRAEEERRRLEIQVQQVQKLESLGLLAGGIAHDFNNILTGVLGTVSLAKNIASGRGLAEVVELMTQAEKAGFQARTLTKQLLTFSKGGTPIKRALAVGPFLREAVSFALHGSAVRCEFHLDPVLWTIQADADQLSQVIHNLVINAKQAMPGGGSLRISAENASVTELPPERRKAERYVKIEVEDKGSGISPEHLPKIFDPYFTTKQDGTGLGLAIVHSIVERHDGFITVESQLGAGTTFTFFLPACDPELAQEQSPVEPSRLRGRVLVMDDQEMIRSVCSTMLTVLGCEVSCAKDGAEALAMYREAKAEGRPFDAVIMDLTVPGGMGGEQAIAHLLEMDPVARAIVSSGYASGPAIGDYKRLGFLAAIGKPYTVEELSRVLGQVLSGEEE